MTCAGLALGLALSAAASRVLTAMLYGVQTIDPSTYAASVLGIGVVAVAAAAAPSIRAARIDPVEALQGGVRARIGLSPAHSVDNESGRASLKLTDSETPLVFASEESRAAKAIREVFESGRPLTYIRSAEEQRVARVLREVVTRLPGASPRLCGHGASRRECVARATGGGMARVALAACWISSPRTRSAAIFHLKDFHEPLRESAEIRRRLRDIYESCRDQRKFVVITSPVRFIPEEVERSLLFLELRPPDLVELVAFLREESGDADDEVIHQLAPALQGLTWMKRGTRCAARWPRREAWGPSRCRHCSKRSGC